MNLEIWNSAAIRPRNPSLSSGHIVLEFDRTKKPKLFSHKLGRITFEAKNINSDRDKIIEVQKGNLGVNGFVFKNVGHTYSDSIVIDKDQLSGSYPVYAHGHPLGGTEHAGMESCSKEGLVCKDGEGEDNLCNPGKCMIGKISYVRNSKWRYESSNKYNSNLPLVYYLNGTEAIELHSILRGKVVGFSDSGAVTLSIDAPASKYSKILLPPKYYFSEDFIDSAVKVIDSRLGSVHNPPKLDLIGVENRKSEFISSFMISVYPGTSEGYISSILHSSEVNEKIKSNLLSVFSSLPPEWFEQCFSVIEEEYLYSEVRNYTNLTFISAVYDRVKNLFESIIQVTGSSFKSGSLEYGKDSIARPVYSRLPGVSEAYRSDPLFSENETPAMWLTSGVDDFLSKKREQITAFYQDYLDVSTCSPLVLDWLAQHVGLFGDLWDQRWNRDIKMALIKNAFGWFDRQKTNTIPGVGDVNTPKGEALNQFPFSSGVTWTSTLSQDNSDRVKYDEIGKATYNGTELVSETFFSQRTYNQTTNLVSISSVNEVKVYDGKWNGLIEAKGSLLSFAFLASVFGLKSHSAQELQVTGTITETLDDQTQRQVLIKRPKSGLRNAEVSAPALWPYKCDPLQVGGETDAKIGNYVNQMVAGVSKATDPLNCKNVFFRVPYYYNRDGKSWDRVKYIVDNWLPDNMNKRVQYAYLSAGLWAVGDAFFDPNQD